MSWPALPDTYSATAVSRVGAHQLRPRRSPRDVHGRGLARNRLSKAFAMILPGGAIKAQLAFKRCPSLDLVTTDEEKA
jgi:hypothetical protein